MFEQNKSVGKENQNYRQRLADELVSFKHANLVDYARTLGYAVIKKESSVGSIKMRGPAGDTIIVSRSNRNHFYIFFTVGDGGPQGTIIDLAKHHLGVDFKGACKHIREWTGTKPVVPPSPHLKITKTNPVYAASRVEAMPSVLSSDYLEKERLIANHILLHPRFKGRIKTDERGNLVFPHFNLDGYCGAEVKNLGFTGFVRGSVKGLWTSNVTPDDNVLIVTESSIDALSWATLRAQELNHTRLVSTSGQISPDQCTLLKRCFQKLRSGEVVLALDSDQAGRDLADQIESLFHIVNPKGVKIRRDVPRAKDWNEELKRVSQKCDLNQLTLPHVSNAIQRDPEHSQEEV